MCKVYNTIGSLTSVKSYLWQHNINEFKSLNEVINFQKNYGILRQRIFSNLKESISFINSILMPLKVISKV